jgi:hypothetical protein
MVGMPLVPDCLPILRKGLQKYMLRSTFKSAGLVFCISERVKRGLLENVYFWSLPQSCYLLVSLSSAMLHKVSFALVVLVLLSASLALGATITLFQAGYDNANVRVVWEVASETGVQNYDLYRKANNEPTFTKLTAISPSGQARYQYLDTDVYRGTAGGTGTMGGPFTYRLTVHTTTGDQSYTSTLGQTPSAVQRSWGSIKSMFR